MLVDAALAGIAGAILSYIWLYRGKRGGVILLPMIALACALVGAAFSIIFFHIGVALVSEAIAYALLFWIGFAVPMRLLAESVKFTHGGQGFLWTLFAAFISSLYWCALFVVTAVTVVYI